MNYLSNLKVETSTYENETELIKKTDILLVTVNEVERESVLKYLLPVPSRNDAIIAFVHERIKYRIGRLGCYLIAHVESGMGSVNERGSLLTVSDAIGTITPKLVIMVGVAFGINKLKQKLGDVLVSKRIINYDIVRVNSGQEDTPRDNYPLSGKLLFNVFSSIIDWNHFLTKRQKAKVISGDLLSGEKLIDDPVFRDKLKKIHPKSIGGEMEGTGVSSACTHRRLTEWIIIKGICDWADGKKNKRAQPKAADSAMSLVFHVLSERNIFSEENIFCFDDNTVETENNKYILNARRGSPLWTLNRLRSSLIPMLIKDLKSYKRNGYSEEICNAVKKDLNSLGKEITKLPKSYHGGVELNRAFSELIDYYIKWNNVEGSSKISKKDRIKNRYQMKKRRDKLGEIIRLTQKELNENIAEINTVDMFNHQEELLNKYPDVFPNFKRAVRRVKKNIIMQKKMSD